jgi:hypothetical protein
MIIEMATLLVQAIVIALLRTILFVAVLVAQTLVETLGNELLVVQMTAIVIRLALLLILPLALLAFLFRPRRLDPDQVFVVIAMAVVVSIITIFAQTIVAQVGAIVSVVAVLAIACIVIVAAIIVAISEEIRTFVRVIATHACPVCIIALHRKVLGSSVTIGGLTIQQILPTILLATTHVFAFILLASDFDLLIITLSVTAIVAELTFLDALAILLFTRFADSLYRLLLFGACLLSAMTRTCLFCIVIHDDGIFAFVGCASWPGSLRQSRCADYQRKQTGNGGN